MMSNIIKKINILNRNLKRNLNSSATAATLWKPDSPSTNKNPAMIGRIGTLEEELATMNLQASPLAEKDPLSVVHWAKQEFQGRVAMSTSMGLQAAVLLHLATRVMPDIPVVWVDTGYLPPETYKYAQDLKEALDLNLIVASNMEWTPARMEAVHGKLWEKDDEASHTLYGKMRKVVPLKIGLDSINPQPVALLSGLRAGQTKARANMEVVGYQHGRFKVLPMLRMSDKDVADYMDKHDLPKHPLQAKGYVTVGDWHSSRPVEKGEDGRATRFGGKFEECGLHVDEPEKVPSTSSSKEIKVDTSMAAATHTIPRHQAEPVQKGLESLSFVKAHSDTDLAVIMVKKLLEDGSPCRKCEDVRLKIEKDNIGSMIGHIAVANILDNTSEGVMLAKKFDVATAPFFLIRTTEEEKAHKPWRPIRSYLQLKKILETAKENVDASRASIPKVDPIREANLRRIEEIKAQISILQAQMLDVQTSLSQNP